MKIPNNGQADVSNNSAPSWEDESCRRDKDDDRRQDHTRAMFYSLVKGRRKGARRDLDRQKAQYLDVHEPSVMAVTLGIVLLCVADAYLTLAILQRGGEELNPFMLMLLQQDVMLFFSVKFIVTTICLVFTVVHKQFKILRTISGYHILYGVFAVYTMLVYYEIVLLAR